LGLGSLSAPTPVGVLNFSVAFEADRDLAGLDDYRDLAPAVGKLQHARQTGIVFQDIDVFERNLATGEVLTGPRGVASEILAKNNNCFHNSHWPRWPVAKLRMPQCSRNYK
jgi:hypothetical protein